VLIPDPQVAQRYGRSLRSLARWDEDKALGFPRPILIRGRKYRDLAALDAWDERQRGSSAAAVLAATCLHRQEKVPRSRST
jgi:hypothetical protein